MTSRLRVLFAGGGTGGHLYPGLAIARALAERRPDVQPFFVGARRGIEKDVLPTTEFPHALLDLHPLYRSNPLKNIRTFRGALSAWRGIGAIAREQRPHLVVGTGGYAAGAALAWARVHRIPIALHELDSHPGLTTRVFASSAKGIFLGFPEAASHLRARKDAVVVALGAPILPPPPVRTSRAEARARWSFPPDVFVVLVTGGSQGAKALNDAVDHWCREGLPDGVALIWGTGKAHIEHYRHRESPMVRVRPYLAPIGDAYAAADVAITRAGAMTIAELCAWEIPSILVPLPTAAQDHQTHNARTVAAAGAAIHLPQTELSGDTLHAQVTELRARGDVLATMRLAARARARPNAARDIADALSDMLPDA